LRFFFDLPALHGQNPHWNTVLLGRLIYLGLICLAELHCLSAHD